MSKIAQEVFRLMFQVVQVGGVWKPFGRHGTFLSLAGYLHRSPKVSSYEQSRLRSGLSPFRRLDAPPKRE